MAIFLALLVWVSLCLFSLIVLVKLNLQDIKLRFTEQSVAYVDALNRTMVSSETVLNGFAALYSAIGNTDPDRVSIYVKSVIGPNPQIFALEIIQKVAKEQIDRFVAEKRLAGTKNFTVKSFSFTDSRGWRSLEDKPFYYPVIYAGSLESDSSEILGLDVAGVPSTQNAVVQSVMQRRPITSHPFRLVEGNLGYVVFSPIKSEANMIVDMLIDVDKLLRPDVNMMRDGFTATLYHKDFSPQDIKGQLFSVAGRARSAVEGALFPTYQYQQPLVTMDEPFAVMMTRQTGWTDLSLGLIALLALLSFASSSILYIYLRAIQRGRASQINHQNVLWKLANHDELTGIPNRMLMLDRLEQAMAASDRNGEYGAVIFLDIDNFKTLNDTKGHDAGDLLLIEVAKRIKGSIREIDTAARLGGDEFVVVLNELGADFEEAHVAAMHVANKIRTTLEAPCRLQLFDYQVTASLGIALFKGNEKTINQLLKSADAAMYEQKASHQ